MLPDEEDIEEEHARLLMEEQTPKVYDDGLYTLKFFKVKTDEKPIGLWAPSHSTIRPFSLTGVNDFRDFVCSNSDYHYFVMRSQRPPPWSLQHPGITNRGKYHETGSGFYSCYNYGMLCQATDSSAYTWDSTRGLDLVLGVCRISGETHLCPRGVRSEFLEILALYSPHEALREKVGKKLRVDVYPHDTLPLHLLNGYPLLYIKLMESKPITDEDHVGFPLPPLHKRKKFIHYFFNPKQ